MAIEIRDTNYFQKLSSEPEFCEEKHLQLEAPKETWTLTDFGYSKELQEKSAFEFTICSPFRMLSKEGLAACREVVFQLEKEERSSERMGRFIRGGVYRSKFLRDLSQSQLVNNFISELVGKKVLPHSMPLYQAHINLLPKDRKVDIDKWHTDTVCLDYVLMLTNPKSIKGGSFQFFRCTKEKAAQELLENPQTSNYVTTVEFPEAGFALLQQGNLVVHRPQNVEEGEERISLVNSFISCDPKFNDVSRLNDCKPVDPAEVLYTEWARHKAYQSQIKLKHLIDTLAFTTDKNHLCKELRLAIRDVEIAIQEIQDETSGRLVHFGGDALTDPQV